MTMAAAAWEQDASALHQHVRYEGWDADMLTGCVCDPGWEGHNCADAACPKNVDLHAPNVEVQTITTTAQHQSEVQRLSLGVSTPANALPEVQEFFIAFDASRTQLPVGDFSIRFDARYAIRERVLLGAPASSECAYCSHEPEARALFSADLELHRFGSAATRAAATAALIEQALESFAVIDDVVVTGALETSLYYGYKFTVTFVGPKVRGTLPAIQTVDVTTLGAVPQAEATRTVVGSHLTGPVVLQYDSSLSFQRLDLLDVLATTTHADCALAYPAFFDEVDGDCLGVNSSPEKVKRILELLPNVDTVEVTFEHATPAGIEWVVSFTSGLYSQGDIADVGSPTFPTDTTAVQDASGSALGAPLLTTTTLAHGRFLDYDSKFGLSISWDGDTFTTEMTAGQSAATLEAAIEAWDLGGGPTYRIGDIAVNRFVAAHTNEDADTYMGELSWAVTFVDVAEDVPTMTFSAAATPSERLTAEPTSGPDQGGAAVIVSAESKHSEVITVRSKVDAVKERQRIDVDGSAVADVDEVFTITVTSTDTTWPKGYLRVQFDSTGAKCPMCSIKGTHAHSGTDGDFLHLQGWPDSQGVDFNAGDPAHIAYLEGRAAASTKAALERLPNIGLGGVDVSATMTSDATPSYTYTLSVTFSGVTVGGDIDDAALTLLPFADGTTLSHAAMAFNRFIDGLVRETYIDESTAVTTSVSSTQDGALLMGDLSLTYDPSDALTNHPTVPTAGPTTAVVDLSTLMTTTGITAPALEDALEGALAEVESGSLDVSVHFDGTHSFSAYITFDTKLVAGVVVGAANRGTRAKLGCDASAVSVQQAALEGVPTPLAGAVTCSPFDGRDACQLCKKGTYLFGTWRLLLSYDGVHRSTQELQWDADGSAVQAAVAGLFDASFRELRDITVSSSEYILNTAESFKAASFGEREWAISAPGSKQGLFNATAEPVTLTGIFSDAAGEHLAGFSQPIITPGSPLGGVDEVQLLECVCGSGTCSGAFKLSLLGASTAAIPHDASAATVRSALLAAFPAIPTTSPITDIEVSILPTTSSSVCEGGAAVTTAVRFKHWLGNLPTMAVDPSDPTAMTLAASSGAVQFRIKGQQGQHGTAGFAARDGTKRGVPCSGRGTCVPGSATALPTCECLRDPSQVAPATLYTGHDCSERSITPTSCPVNSAGVPCSGHGTCSGPPSFSCTCSEGYTGPECAALACPTANAWFDEAVSKEVAHGRVACAGMGDCSAKGECACRSSFSDGRACQTLRCPASDSGCGGRGHCMTMAQLGQSGVSSTTGRGGNSYYDGPWDAHMLTGCYCGDGVLTKVGPRRYEWGEVLGWRCSHKHCPGGEDPKRMRRSTWGGVGHEVQQFSCTGDAGDGFLRITFRNSTTTWLDADAPSRDADQVFTGPSLSVEAALNELPELFGVQVSSDDAQLCKPAGATTMVTFRGRHGLDPGMLLVEANGTLAVSAVTRRVPSTLGNFECNRRGVCDHRTGQCRCQPGYGSSSGNNTAGDKGDCGHADVDYLSAYLRSATVHPGTGAVVFNGEPGAVFSPQNFDFNAASLDSILAAHASGGLSEGDALQAIMVQLVTDFP